MNLSEKTKSILRRHRILPNRHLGQNFTIDSSITQCIIDYALLGKSDVVLDIGAGLGFLTRLLASKCDTVIAVEADARLVRVLREQLKDLVNINIINGDVFRVQLPRFNKVISIPPYRISSRLISWLFNIDFDCAVLVFQKEFVDRLDASIGSDGYGWLTVIACYYAEIELLDSVPKSMFYPQPKVDSIIVRLKPKIPRPFNLKNEKLFRQLVPSLFAQRNRKVRNAILPFVEGTCGIIDVDAQEMVDALPFCDRRVRELAPEDFGALANVLSG